MRDLRKADSVQRLAYSGQEKKLGPMLHSQRNIPLGDKGQAGQAGWYRNENG